MHTPLFRLFDKGTNDFFKPTYQAQAGMVEYPILTAHGTLAFVVMEGKQTKVIGEGAPEYFDRFCLSYFTGQQDIALPEHNNIFTGDILYLAPDLVEGGGINGEGYYLVSIQGGCAGWIGPHAGVFHPFVKDKMPGIVVSNIWKDKQLLSTKQLLWWASNVSSL